MSAGHDSSTHRPSLPGRSGHKPDAVWRAGSSSPQNAREKERGRRPPTPSGLTHVCSENPELVSALRRRRTRVAAVRHALEGTAPLEETRRQGTRGATVRGGWRRQVRPGVRCGPWVRECWPGSGGLPRRTLGGRSSLRGAWPWVCRRGAALWVEVGSEAVKAWGEGRVDGAGQPHTALPAAAAAARL